MAHLHTPPVMLVPIEIGDDSVSRDMSAIPWVVELIDWLNDLYDSCRVKVTVRFLPTFIRVTYMLTCYLNISHISIVILF